VNILHLLRPTLNIENVSYVQCLQNEVFHLELFNAAQKGTFVEKVANHFDTHSKSRQAVLTDRIGPAHDLNGVFFLYVIFKKSMQLSFAAATLRRFQKP
jgi:hypothetical protein